MHEPRKTDFSEALYALKHGREIARDGWNGKGMFLFLHNDRSRHIRLRPTNFSYYMAASDASEAVDTDYFHVEPHIVMKTADGKYIPWLASQSDLLATDWVIDPR